MIYQTQQQPNTLNLSSKLSLIEHKHIQNISCIEIYDDQLYIGTYERVHIYTLTYKQNELQLINQRSFYPHCAKIHSIVASPLFLIVVPLKEQQLIRIWNRQKLCIVHGCKGHSKQISCLIMLKDKKHMASTSHDGTARIWSIQQPFKQQEQIQKYTSKYPLLCLAQLDSDTIVFGGDDCFIMVWNWQLRQLIAQCFAHVGSITFLSSFGSRRLYSMGGDSTIKVWQIHQNMNDSQIILDDDINQSFQINLLKQQQKKLSQNIFKIQILANTILAIDSKGHTYMMNGLEDINEEKLRLQYTDQILNVKQWKNCLLIVVFQQGSGKLHKLSIQLQDKVEQIGELHTKTIEISAGTKHSIFIQSNQSDIQIIDVE